MHLGKHRKRKRITHGNTELHLSRTAAPPTAGALRAQAIMEGCVNVSCPPSNPVETRRRSRRLSQSAATPSLAHVSCSGCPRTLSSICWLRRFCAENQPGVLHWCHGKCRGRQVYVFYHINTSSPMKGSIDYEARRDSGSTWPITVECCRNTQHPVTFAIFTLLVSLVRKENIVTTSAIHRRDIRWVRTEVQTHSGAWCHHGVSILFLSGPRPTKTHPNSASDFLFNLLMDKICLQLLSLSVHQNVSL